MATLTLQELQSIDAQKDAEIFDLKLKVSTLQEQLEEIQAHEGKSTTDSLRDLLDRRNRDAQADGRQIKLQQQRLELLASELAILQREKKESLSDPEHDFSDQIRQLEEKISYQTNYISELKEKINAAMARQTHPHSSDPNAEVERSAMQGRVLSKFARRLQDQAAATGDLVSELNAAREQAMQYKDKCTEMAATIENLRQEVSTLTHEKWKAIEGQRREEKSNAARAAFASNELAQLEEENRKLAEENGSLRGALESISRQKIATDISESDFSDLFNQCKVLQKHRTRLTQTVARLAKINKETLLSVKQVRQEGI